MTPTTFSTKRSPMKTKIWITDCNAYGRTKLTCVETTRTLQQIYQDVYFFLWEAAGLREEADENGDYYYDETEPHVTTTCHLLIKYFGYELCEWSPGIPELDQSWLWEGPQHFIVGYRPRNKTWRKHWKQWMYLTRFRWGLLKELEDLFRGRSEEYRSTKYPWSTGYQSVTYFDSGLFIYRIPFAFFWDRESAMEFGDGVLSIEPIPGGSSLGRIRYFDVDGSRTWGSFQLDKVKLYHRPIDVEVLADLEEVVSDAIPYIPHPMTEKVGRGTEMIDRGVEV